MKIVTKVTLMTAVLIAMIGVASPGFVYFFEYKQIKAEAMVDMERMSARLFDMLNVFLYDRISDIESFASSPEFASEKYSSAEITAKLLEYRDIYKCYDSLALFDLNRVRIADTAGVNLGMKHSLSEFWLDPLLAERAVLYPAISETVDAPVIYLSYPVRNAERKVVRIMVARIPMSKLGEILKTRGKYYFEGSVKVDLLDKDGILLNSNHNSRGVLKEKPLFWRFAEGIIKREARPAPFFFEENERGEVKDGGTTLIYVLPQPAYLDFEGGGWFLTTALPLRVALGTAVTLRNYLINRS